MNTIPAVRFLILAILLCGRIFPAESFDAAPFAHPLTDGPGIFWEDPREIHRVIVEFETAPPEDVKLEYWGSRWPEQHLPKDKPMGAGGTGWMELGNWYNGGWRTADVRAEREGNQIRFRFQPVNAREFPALKDYPAEFRYTLKLRLTGSVKLPKVKSLRAFTDSTLAEQSFSLLFRNPPGDVQLRAFNGAVEEQTSPAPDRLNFRVRHTVNTDPNSFDPTLVTVQSSNRSFTFSVNDLREPLILSSDGVAVTAAADSRSYSALVQSVAGRKTLYEQVKERPEQTWRAAWESMPPKKSPIYLPLGTDGGRHRFQLNPDGGIEFRSNDAYLSRRPGKDSPALKLEKANRKLSFGLPARPVERWLEDDSMPICRTVWEKEGMRIEQLAFESVLRGTGNEVPASDETGVFLARFKFTNAAGEERQARLSMELAGEPLVAATNGWLKAGELVRGQISFTDFTLEPGGRVALEASLKPGESKTLVLKFPYLPLVTESDQAALAHLDFDREHSAVASYWKRRLDQSARLITPEPVLNQFYRAIAGHLLINCEREPNAERRFARVGSFQYGAYGNESCMMVVDLDRRGFHKEAEECLDAWLEYQGTVGLPGDFSSKEGVLYGAGGYEAGGYNQHHGWILWCIAEHFRFTRDAEWMNRSAAGVVKACDWIIRESSRPQQRDALARGLLPPGTLEDIGDWWTWLSTSCYTWRGLDSAAWALKEIHHPEAARIREEANNYRDTMLRAFHAAAERSPVVRLRNGTAVPHFPSYIERRGRSFGWICETLEGAIHLLITGALPADSPEATWILNDYEDNLFLSAEFGYTLDDFDRYWFSRGGMSMQACLLLDAEPFLFRDDVKNALRAIFNAIAVSHFPDVHMNTEHALPEMGDWRGDHYKSSDEANAAGWLRYLFVRESGDELLIGQAVPRDWLKAGEQCGIERTATWFGGTSIRYTGGKDEITAKLEPPRRNPPARIRVRFREPGERLIQSVTVNGKPWEDFSNEWVNLPATVGPVTVVARF